MNNLANKDSKLLGTKILTQLHKQNQLMNASAYLLLAALICVAGGGCATDSIPVRVTEISAVRTYAESSVHDGLSVSVATKVFQEVTSHLGTLGRANPPHEYTDPSRPGWVEHAVQFTPEGANSVDLTMDVDGRYIIFRGTTDIEPESLAALQKAMKLCRESLDKRRIKDEVRTHTTHFSAAKK